MKGIEALPARVLDELIRRVGADEAVRLLGLANWGELPTLTAKVDRKRPPEIY
ncbi:MAG: hypothetical protein WA622_00040 [Mycobacterium sp.]|uniref:hypothetical protein n=1 Tax=Mycobacterium sp. TaxID=1785 RepID=UPI003BB7F7A0